MAISLRWRDPRGPGAVSGIAVIRSLDQHDIAQAGGRSVIWSRLLAKIIGVAGGNRAPPGGEPAPWRDRCSAAETRWPAVEAVIVSVDEH